MAWSIGIHLGDGIVEIAAASGDQTVNKRVLCAMNSSEQYIAQFFSDYKIPEVDSVKIVTNWPMVAFEQEMGTSPALVTTLGFESWLEVSTPLKDRYYSINAERPTLITNKNLIFGLPERTQSSGKIERHVNESDLEFLAAKLEMHEIKTLGVMLIHSNQNPKNEQVIKEFFEKRGVLTYLSSSNPKGDEKARFWSAAINTYLSPFLQERWQSLGELFTKLGVSHDKIKIGKYSFPNILSGAVSPLELAFAYTNTFVENLANDKPLIFFGLARFLLFDKKEVRHEFPTPFGPIAATHYAFSKLPIQPLSVLERGFHSAVAFGKSETRFDPGPMVLGRGLQPTYIDLLSLESSLTKIFGISDRLSDRGTSRLKENFAAYAKTGSSRSNMDVDSLKKELMFYSAQLMVTAIYNTIGNESFTFCGPLAPLVVPQLKAVCGVMKGEIYDDEFSLVNSLLKGKK